MLRQEVEALLKMEGLDLIVNVKRWNGYHHKTPNTVSWSAAIIVNELQGVFRCEGALTNHQAAKGVYKGYIKYKEENGNH